MTCNCHPKHLIGLLWVLSTSELLWWKVSQGHSLFSCTCGIFELVRPMQEQAEVSVFTLLTKCCQIASWHSWLPHSSLLCFADSQEEQTWGIKKLDLFLHIFDCTDHKWIKFSISVFLHWKLCVRNWFICCLNMQSSSICENTCRKCKVQGLCWFIFFFNGVSCPHNREHSFTWCSGSSVSFTGETICLWGQMSKDKLIFQCVRTWVTEGWKFSTLLPKNHPCAVYCTDGKEAALCKSPERSSSLSLWCSLY